VTTQAPVADVVERPQPDAPSRYLDKPSARTMLRAPLTLWRLGLGPLAGRAWMVVTTVGRSSGLPRHTAVYPHVVEGRTYLWCPYGDRAQWFRNVLVDPVVTVQWRHGTKVRQAVPLDDEAEAVRVVAALRRFGGSWFQGYLGSLGMQGTPEEIRDSWQRLHVRRLEAAPPDAVGPPPLGSDLVLLWAVPALVAAAAVVVTRRTRRR